MGSSGLSRLSDFRRKLPEVWIASPKSTSPINELALEGASRALLWADGDRL